MYIPRIISSQIKESLAGEQKVLIIYGPRQAGKTTLLKNLLNHDIEEPYLFFTGDDLYTQEIFGKNDLVALKRAVGDKKLLILDEAQRIDNIGLTLKLLIDNFTIKLVVSGSASFDLAGKINEPLTGRTKTFYLYPFAYQEQQETYQQTLPKSALEEMLRFGMYPKAATLKSEQEKQDYLYEYLSNYLYKDILTFRSIKKPKKVLDLLALLALQIGKEVTVAELAQNLAMSQKTVSDYLDILEKMFVIFNLRGFSRNLRKEIYKSSKYYFFDVGLRNAVIRNFNRLELRQDAGELFENWFIMEKIKLSSNNLKPANFYFWRTYDQKEIDLIEERAGKLMAYECKWQMKKEIHAPKEWLSTYKNGAFEMVSNENYEKFLG